MFVRNRSGFDVVLARTQLIEDVALASLNLELSFSLAEDGTLQRLPSKERSPTDPPDIRRIALWRGVSVTTFGHVEGPPSPPYVRVVELWVGEHVERLAVYGPRVWQLRWGQDLTASEPAPFEALPLSWEHAFGGEYRLPPGPLPGSDLPHPGGRVPYPLNPRGVGFYGTAEAAADQPLPAIERVDSPLRSWADRPLPGGIAPCPDLPGLRTRPEDVADMASRSLERYVAGCTRAALRARHHAQGSLIFDQLPPGTMIATRHVGRRSPSLRFRVPPSPVDVWIKRGRDRTKLEFRLRSIHVDGDARIVRVAFGHPHRYQPASAPEWFEVNERASA